MGSPGSLFLDPPAAEEAERRDALERAGRFLARRARAEAEVRAALGRWGFSPEVAEDTVARLKELDLVNDLDFARQWVEERGSRNGLGPERLVAELAAKGVAAGTAQQALEEAGLDEELAARHAAAALVRKGTSRPLAQQAMRLQQMLLGRGFGLEATTAAVRSVLPPEGWD